MYLPVPSSMGQLKKEYPWIIGVTFSFLLYSCLFIKYFVKRDLHYQINVWQCLIIEIGESKQAKRERG